MLNITGHTQMLCLIGSPVGHSGSPAMYNYSFDKLGLDYVYLAYDVDMEHTPDAFKALRLLNVKGFNITMPGKTVGMQCCDALDKTAELIGAVNTVVNDNGKFIGYNTDGMGWVLNCRQHGVEIKGKKLIVCGSGGAATAIQITAAMQGVRELVIFAIHDSFYANAEETVRKIRENIPGCSVKLCDLEDEALMAEEIATADIFCNATRVGMKPMDDASVLKDTSLLRSDLAVADVVYNPRKTKLLADAEAAGCKTVPGVGMLLWQGAEAFKLYTGKDMPTDEVYEKYFAE